MYIDSGSFVVEFIACLNFAQWNLSMPKLRIVKSIPICASAEKIYAYLGNFNYWLAWSPWLLMEPDAKVTIAGDAKSYQWQGSRVGEGNMQILTEQKNRMITYDLNFIKPWKSKAAVTFSLQKEAEGMTRVSWSMDSSLPFYLFWMKRMMVAYVGMDYERGLKMLKEVIETGEVNSKLEFKGYSEFPAIQYIGIKTLCAIEDMGKKMSSDFSKLNKYCQNDEHLPAARVFSIYHKWDMVRGTAEYTAAISVSNFPNDLPADIVMGNIPATRLYTLRHVGAYEHLGNAWSTLYNMQRSKEFKCQKGIHPFEVYVNDPQQVEEKDLITDINFAVK